jgi:hypothetical protein
VKMSMAEFYRSSGLFATDRQPDPGMLYLLTFAHMPTIT